LLIWPPMFKELFLPFSCPPTVCLVNKNQFRWHNHIPICQSGLYINCIYWKDITVTFLAFNSSSRLTAHQVVFKILACNILRKYWRMNNNVVKWIIWNMIYIYIWQMDYLCCCRIYFSLLPCTNFVPHVDKKAMLRTTTHHLACHEKSKF
jgi:hypothetical protein